MSGSSAHYGVRKLVLINSGNYSYAELDLTAPVHLAAPNNRGKSTLVNALQFLYVDRLSHMRFGSRNVEDTRRHYFGRNPSYLVFECMTPLGAKCLLVAGQGPLNNSNFLRFVFDGPFDRSAFVDDDQRLLTLDQLRRQLAGKGLGEVKPGNLWEVLGSPPANTNNGSLPRLNILPVRARNEYESFRAAFIHLLALSNVSARELRELIITCHTRDITCRKIDVAAEHREEFLRAEQAERALRFTQGVMDDVEKGRTIREDIAGAAQELGAQATSIAPALVEMFQAITHVHASAAGESRKHVDRRRTLANRKDKLNQQLGRLRSERDTTEEAWKSLQGLHAKWSTCSKQMLDTMRDNVATLDGEIVKLREDLERAEQVNVEAMRRRVKELDGQVGRKQRVLDNWETRAINALRDSGLTDEQIGDLFTLINPHLLDLSVGEDIRIRDESLLRRELLGLHEAIADGQYRDSAVEVQLARLPGASLPQTASRESLRDDIEVTKRDLSDSRRQLEVAENQAQAAEQLKQKQAEKRRLVEQLQEHDAYAQQWADRQLAIREIERATERVGKIEAKIIDLKGQIEELDNQVRMLDGVQHESAQVREGLRKAARRYEEMQAEAELDIPLAKDVGEGAELPSQQETWAEVRQRAANLHAQLEAMQNAVGQIEKQRRQLERTQKSITEASHQFEGQIVYFSDADADWERLIEMIESLPEQMAAVEQAWSSLFTRVGAKLSEIKHGVAEIRTAVNRITRGLTDYRVSNLRSVQLEVVVDNQAFDLVETLTSEGGIFQDHEKIDRAKRQMERWIRDGKVIQLDELFAIHIKVHERDGERPLEARSLDEIGSTGTGMTAKAMVFVQLVRAVVGQENYRLHFYLDETGQLDEQNLAATTRMAVDKGVMPITADPDVRIEPLAHPTVTVYSLGQKESGDFFIDQCRTCRGHRADLDDYRMATRS
ncbi:MAG: hypothetical protein WD294_04810 [Phycisphaeraceae bacterium]